MDSSQLAPNAVQALDKAFELAGRLADAMAQTLAARGLTPSRAELIVVLRGRGSLLQRELSEALRCSPRHVTTLVDTLEAGGWVQRHAHPTDRRATLVSLTAQGEDAATRMDAERQQAARLLLGDAPPNDLAAFIAVADRLLTRLRVADHAHGYPEP